MAFTISKNLRDREFSKFAAAPTGSETAVNVNIVSGVNITIGSVFAEVDTVYVQSGDNLNLGTAWTGVGSVTGTVSTTLAGSMEVFQTTASDMAVQLNNGALPINVLGSVECSNADASDLNVTVYPGALPLNVIGSVECSNADADDLNVTVHPGPLSIPMYGSVAITTEEVTVGQGPLPWIMQGSVAITTSEVTVQQGPLVWTVVGSQAITNTVTVEQGPLSWIITGSVLSRKGDTHYAKVLKTLTLHAASTANVWATEGAGSTINITDIAVSTGSGADENLVTLNSHTTDLTASYLSPNGGFVSNLQTPIPTAAAGSVTMTTTTEGSTSVTLTGYVTR